MLRLSRRVLVRVPITGTISLVERHRDAEVDVFL